MKISAALFVAAVRAECPVDWTLGTDNNCSPDYVDVVCTTDTMTVTFPLNAVYNDGEIELDADQVLLAAADIVGQDKAGCVDFAYDSDDEQFTASISLDDCGITASHEGGYLIFDTSFTGDEAALLRDGIITTKVLTFNAQCKYADTATVAVDGIAVEMGETLVETVSSEGVYSFTMASYSDDAFSAVADADNLIEIGDVVYNRIITTDTLPTNVNFHTTTCTAYSELNADKDGGATDSSSYMLFNNNVCTAELVDVTIDDTTGDSTDSYVSFSFNSFTFEAEADSVAVVCEVKLCLADETDCYVTSGDACTDAKYTLDE